MKPAIHTTLHRIPANRYMTTVSEEWLARYWPALALPVAICVAIGLIVDPAFTFVAFMLLCIILPFVMMMLYFNYALTPEATMAVRPHVLSVDQVSGIDVTFAPDPVTGREYSPVHLDWQEVSKAEIRSNDVVLRLHGRNFRYVIIPYSALTDDAGCSQPTDQLHRMLLETGKIPNMTL
ncbi:MAG: hypothetical protein K2L71_00595 [Muribaculaceae bacterium]|nr:hypothetical protein [Muribaculaceae bacterium]